MKKRGIKKRIALLMAVTISMSLLLSGCGKSAAVKSVEESIATIDINNLDVTSVYTTKEAYDALTEKEKEKVENTDLLNSAVVAADEIVYTDSYNEIFGLLGTVSKDCDYCCQLISEVWDTTGPDYFSTCHQLVKSINQANDFEKCDIPTLSKLMLASIFCSDKIDNDINSEGWVSDTGISLIVGICATYNLKTEAISTNLNSVKDLLANLRTNYSDKHASEIDELQNWYGEASVYGDFALNPSGSYISYTGSYKEKSESMNFYITKCDIYSAPEIAITGEGIENSIKDEIISTDIKAADIGDVVLFGDYDGNNDWLVINKDGDKVLLISRYVICNKMFNYGVKEQATWETCSLRTWLNTAFLDTAFSDKEKSSIIETAIYTPDNEKYKTAGGKSTKDKVFILSLDEAEDYFSTDSERIAYCAGFSTYNSFWWLRSPGFGNFDTAAVFSDGYISSYGIERWDGKYIDGSKQVAKATIGARPVVWVDTSKL